MKKFRKVWDAEKNEFLKATKGLHRLDALATFYAAYPELRGDVSPTAFFNQRSRVGAAEKRPNGYKGGRTPRPIGAEQVKKGYVRIKVAHPNVWMSKAKWVYKNAHPGEDLSERSNYVFLDGDNRNFAPDNIARVPLKLMAVFNLLGGTEEGCPEATRVRLAQAKLKVASLDLAEKVGEVALVPCKGRTMRVYKPRRNELARALSKKISADPERRRRRNERAKVYLAKKRLDPEWVEKSRKYAREWAKRKREERKR